ncbi:hypothetical protein ACES2J_16235 [Bdellovibrio bacteriovorus]|uniref:hypothetical protein n=1 Tax=Bdellovibrio bacteriovorus TaxID=959 RepID=UPI0035A5F006
MKLISKLMVTTSLLALAACSGGGGGGGGGSNNGDVANPTPTITSPPTAAKGTAAELGTILDEDAAGTQAQVVNFINSFSMISLGGGPVRQGRGGYDCSEPTADWTDADNDMFFASLNFKISNCAITDEELPDHEGVYNESITSTDSDDSTFWANASLSYSEDYSMKKNGSTDIYEYESFKANLDMSKGLTLSFKEGGYDKIAATPLPNRYVAYWLNFEADEESNVAITGYVQVYAEGKGLVTVSVHSTGYTMNLNTQCVTGGEITLKYADGTAASAAVPKDICFNSAPTL